jgi:hypothetical protein
VPGRPTGVQGLFSEDYNHSSKKFCTQHCPPAKLLARSAAVMRGASPKPHAPENNESLRFAFWSCGVPQMGRLDERDIFFWLHSMNPDGLPYHWRAESTQKPKAMDFCQQIQIVNGEAKS